jgi:predicted Fe-S protein YdhL (DUF1289 family)
MLTMLAAMNHQIQPDEIASPCTGKCTMHDALPWCTGCGRTLEEIAAWPEADEELRLVITKTLPRRMRMLGAV